MLDFSDGWFMFPLRIVQFVTSLIGLLVSCVVKLMGLVLICAIAGRINLPHFVSTIGSPSILLIGVKNFVYDSKCRESFMF
jgi:hypothetical protein